MCTTSNLVFKGYSPNQVVLLPPAVEELTEENHPVRVVNDVIDRINIESLLKQYKPGGTSMYHPRMLLKVLVYIWVFDQYLLLSQDEGGFIRKTFISCSSRP